MNEIERLIPLLAQEGVPFETRKIVFGSTQICFPNIENCTLDAVSHMGSYGGSQGLIEIMGEGENSDLTDHDVIGWLTAEEALNYFLKAESRRLSNL